jgi:hypothetical protein
MAFGLAMVIGGARIGDALGWWTTPRLSLISAHFHLAAGGFATMILLGVGSRMTPMFLGSETTGEPAWFEIWLRRALALGTVVYAAGAIASSAPVAWAGALVMGIAVCGALWRTAGWFRHRSAPRLDPSTALLLGAHLWLGSGLLLGIDVLWRGPRNPGVMTSYAVMILLGWLGSSIVAVSYRVLPNLAWHHRFGAKPRSPGTPSPAQMVVPPLAWVAGAAYSAGVLAIVGGLHRGNPALVQTGGVMIGAGIVATISHHLRLMLVGRAAAAPGA